MNAKIVRRRLLDWYAQHKRRLPWRETSDPYAIWVSEVMLQQTQVATVVPYYIRFMRRFPTPARLARADIQDVLKLWEGLGYYSRARHLHRAAAEVVRRHHGKVPNDPDAFRSLPGVGDYIAAAVLSIAFGHVLPVVDGNVKRVLSRLMEIDAPVNRSDAHKIYRVPSLELICPDRPADFNQAIMELGALICRPKRPLCDDCPLGEVCLARINGNQAIYPKRDARRKVPQRHVDIAVILKKRRMLVVQRPMEGFLGGLWEFPAVPADGVKTDPARLARDIQSETGLSVAVDRHLTRIRHTYTHFKLTADVYLCGYMTGRVRLRGVHNHRWATLRSLDRLPMHKANHKFLNLLQSVLPHP